MSAVEPGEAPARCETCGQTGHATPRVVDTCLAYALGQRDDLRARVAELEAERDLVGGWVATDPDAREAMRLAKANERLIAAREAAESRAAGAVARCAVLEGHVRALIGGCAEPGLRRCDACTTTWDFEEEHAADCPVPAARAALAPPTQACVRPRFEAAV